MQLIFHSQTVEIKMQANHDVHSPPGDHSFPLFLSLSLMCTMKRRHTTRPDFDLKHFRILCQ